MKTIKVWLLAFFLASPIFLFSLYQPKPRPALPSKQTAKTQQVVTPPAKPQLPEAAN